MNEISTSQKKGHQTFLEWEKDQGNKTEIKVLDIPNYLHFENDKIIILILLMFMLVIVL